MESFVDEIAAATKKDPVALRMEMLKATPVPQMCQAGYRKSRWAKAAAGARWGGADGVLRHSALVAEVSMVNGAPKAQDHGSDRLRHRRASGPGHAQIESGILLGFSSGMNRECDHLRMVTRNSAT